MGNNTTLIAPRSPLWSFAQLVALAATAAIIVGLFAMPEPTLAILWNIVIPLVPASLLVSPTLWRGVCPLASLNMALNGLAGRRALSPRAAKLSGAAGIILLAVLVPARRFLFNSDGVALAVVILAVALTALVLGSFFDAKAGFCNAFCPVLPVERLYGQQPLIEGSNPRCIPCTVCAVGCIDLDPQKSIAQTLGPARHSGAWLLSPFGIFAAAFPGFVVGYYTTVDVELAAAGSIYLNVLAWSAAAYVISAVVYRAFKLNTRTALIISAAAAASLYYWFVAPLIAGTTGGGMLTIAAVRIAAFALIVIWLWHGLSAASTRPEAVSVRS